MPQFSKNIFFKLFLFLIFVGLLNVSTSAASKTQNSNLVWTGSWTTAPQWVEPNNMPPAPGLSNNSFRQVIRVSLGGKTLRLRFTNLFSKNPLTLKSVGIVVSKGGSEIDGNISKLLKFSGNSEVTLAPNTELTSDELPFNLAPTTAGAIAVLGNSIADGRGSGINKQNRWPDVFSERLLKNSATSQCGVLNLGIGGNCVLRGGLGQTALKRFDRDILSQSNVKWLIVCIPTNWAIRKWGRPLI